MSSVEIEGSKNSCLPLLASSILFQDMVKLTNVPLVIKPPIQNETRNGVTDEMVELIDLAGTIYNYANIEPSYWHFGKSLKSLI